MSQVQVTVIGCGDFGAQVTAHLGARGLTGPGLLTWTSAATTRLAGAELARQRMLGFSEPAGGSIHLIAAADEAAGSGLLTTILSELGSRHEWNLWVALPQAGADAAVRARVYATLLELGALRRQGCRFAVWLHERGGGPAETPQRLGDGLLYHVRRGVEPYAPDGAYRGFGVGVLREPTASLRERLARQVAVQVVEQYLQRPDPAHLLSGMREALQRPIRPLLIPAEVCPVYQERWSAVTAGGGNLEALLDYYEPTGAWHQEAYRFWDQLVGEARVKLGSAMGYAWRSGFAVIYAEAREARALAHAVLETEIEQCEQAVIDHQVQFEGALREAEQGEISLDRLDRLVAAYLLESVRLGALERLALAFDGAIELVMDGLWVKAESVRQLLQSVKKQRSGRPAVRVAHGLTLVPSAQQEQEWLGEIQPRLTRATLHDAESPTAEMVLESARRDVDRYIRTRQPDLHLPRGHRTREVWLDGTLPRITLVGAESPPCVYEVSPGLPVSYWEDLMIRSPSLKEQPIEWFPDEWIVYAETPPFTATELANLPSWAEGYRAAPPAARAWLHVLPEPPGGWPDPVRGVHHAGIDAAPTLVAGSTVTFRDALTALRCLLLGLITPDGAGNLTLNTPVDGWEPGHSVGALGDLLAALTAGGGLDVQLAAQADERRQQLPLLAVAGYYALLRWFQTAILDGDRGSLDQGRLRSMHQAVESERTEVAQQLEAAGADWLWRGEESTRELGSPRDKFSAGAGPWRYLRPVER